MNAICHSIAAALCVALLAGCAGTTRMSASSPVRMAPGLTMTMPRQDALGRDIDAAQYVVARYGDTAITFESRIHATADGFVLVCNDGLGRRTLTVTWTASGIRFERAPWFPRTIDPRNMLADLIVIYWPADVVTKALPGAVLHDEAGLRTVALKGKVIQRVAYAPGEDGDIWSGNVTYRNDAWHYTLSIQSTRLP